MYKDFRNTFIFGEPGTGKSKVLRNYIEEVLYDKEDTSDIVLIAHKDLGYISSRIVKEITHDFEEQITELYNEFLERLEKGKDSPRVYVFVDGVAKTVRATNEKVEEMLGDMMSRGPKANVICVYASSRHDFKPELLAGSTVIELK